MEYQLTLTQNEIDIVVEGLGQLPLKMSLIVFQKVQQQVLEQQSCVENIGLVAK